ncbi:hypothetical protein BH11ACT6_BH11ACT6_29860 [soil metagenome]
MAGKTQRRISKTHSESLPIESYWLNGDRQRVAA